MIYDHNQISIEDDTNIALTEDVAKRYEAYGWHVQTVDWTDGAGPTSGKAGTYDEDVPALYEALRAAQAETGRPSLVILRTVIAWPAPTLMNTGKSHGSALGEAEVAATKQVLGFDPAQNFAGRRRPSLAHTRGLVERGQAAHAAWQQAVRRLGRRQPAAQGAAVRPAAARELPDGWDAALPTFEAGKDVATRKASGLVLNALKDALPELWGGSADLAESNNTTMEGETVVRRRSSEHHRHVGSPTPTAGCCTSASASTPWARS